MCWLFGSPVVNGLLLAGLPVLIATGVRRWGRARVAFFDLLLGAFALIYLLFHWLVAFPTWDRYLLPMVPILSVLLSRVVRGAISRLQCPGPGCRRVFSGLLLAALLVAPAVKASAGRYPIGAERAAYEGIEEVVSFLGRLPEGSVVYHHWLGWHYRYALFDSPVYLAYWPNPTWLARDVQAFGDREARYLVIPARESVDRVARLLADVGYVLELVLTTAREDGGPSFAIYAVRSDPCR
jgi:hypothetical protein